MERYKVVFPTYINLVLPSPLIPVSGALQQTNIVLDEVLGPMRSNQFDTGARSKLHLYIDGDSLLSALHQKLRGIGNLGFAADMMWMYFLPVLPF